MDKCELKQDLKKDVAQIYWLVLNLGRKTPKKVKAVRCHESVRIFYNVLKKLGYEVEIVNGGCLFSNGKEMAHSWLEYMIDCYGTSLLIETTPHLFFPDLSYTELICKMVIPPDDERRRRYHTIPDNLFFQVLKQRGDENIDEQLIKRYSTSIIRLMRSLKYRKKNKTANTTKRSDMICR